MFVKNTKKSKASPVAGCTQPSEQDAAQLCLTSEEAKSLPDSKMLVIMTAVVEASMCNVLSGDQWYLIFAQARHTCKQVGISEEEFDIVLARLAEAQQKRFQSNPMSSMF